MAGREAGGWYGVLVEVRALGERRRLGCSVFDRWEEVVRRVGKRFVGKAMVVDC